MATTKPPKMLTIHMADSIEINVLAHELTTDKHLVTCIDSKTRNRLDIPLTSIYYISDNVKHKIIPLPETPSKEDTK